MKVTIVRGGGLAGLVKRTELADGELPATAAAEFDALTRSLPAVDPGRSDPAHADELSYELTVGDDSEALPRTLRFGESTLPDSVRALIEWVDARPEQKTTIAPPA